MAKRKVKRERISRYIGPPYRRGLMPTAMTVGELRGVLELYPVGLPIRCSLDEGVKLIWFNVGEDTECLGLEENDGTWDD